MKALTIILNKEEMRYIYAIIKNSINRYEISAGKRLLYNRWLSKMSDIFRECDEFVLVFKDTDIQLLIDILKYEDFNSYNEKLLGHEILKKSQEWFGTDGDLNKTYTGFHYTTSATPNQF